MTDELATTSRDVMASHESSVVSHRFSVISQRLWLADGTYEA